MLTGTKQKKCRQYSELSIVCNENYLATVRKEKPFGVCIVQEKLHIKFMFYHVSNGSCQCPPEQCTTVLFFL